MKMNKSLLTNLASLSLILVGQFSPYYGQTIKTMGLYSFSGAITNWLAIHMLFEKIPFLYGSGVVTVRFQEFKVGIRNLVMNQFFTQENFEKFLDSSAQAFAHIDQNKVISQIDMDRIFNGLKEAIMQSPFGPMLGMLGGENALNNLRPFFEERFIEILKDMLSDENFLHSLTEGAGKNSQILEQVESIVNQRLDELTPQMVKEIIQNMIREHLGWLVVWGGVFGAVIGLISTLFN